MCEAEQEAHQITCGYAAIYCSYGMLDHSSLLLTGQGSTCLPPLMSLQETCQPAGAVSPASWLLPPTTARPHALGGVRSATSMNM